MNLAFPSHLDQPSRDRLARVLAQAELDRLPPINLVLRVFEAFVGEHLDCAYERAEITADQVRAVADEFLAALTRAVYWEYPESVRLPDVEISPGVRIQKHSSVYWDNLRQFRRVIGEELRGNAVWRDLQSAIVDNAENLAGEPASDVDWSSSAPTLQPGTQRSPEELLGIPAALAQRLECYDLPRLQSPQPRLLSLARWPNRTAVRPGAQAAEVSWRTEGA